MSRGQPNVRTGEFRKQFERLPKEIQELAVQAYRLFLDDPHHPMLGNHAPQDTKKGDHREGSRAISITRCYRAIYVVDGPTNVWYWVGSHSDYNNFTGNF